MEPPAKSNDDNGLEARRATGRRWLLGAGLAVAAIVVVIFAAQGGGDGGGPLNAIAKAAEVTQREPGGRAVFHVTIDSATTSEGLTEDGSMTFDDSGRTRATIHFKGHKTGREGNLIAVGDGARSYVSSDLFKTLPEGKRWVELDLTSAMKGSSRSSASPEAGPEEGLEILKKVVGAEKKGKANTEGVPTTRYVGTLPAVEEVLGVKPDISASSFEVWIDAHDRVRQMQIDITGGIEGNPDSTSTTMMTFNYVEFGRVPAIALPPQEEVVDVTGKVEQSMQSAAQGE